MGSRKGEEEEEEEEEEEGEQGLHLAIHPGVCNVGRRENYLHRGEARIFKRERSLSLFVLGKPQTKPLPPISSLPLAGPQIKERSGSRATGDSRVHRRWGGRGEGEGRGGGGGGCHLVLDLSLADLAGLGKLCGGAARHKVAAFGRLKPEGV